MAPTKANATYVVTTISLLTKGLVKPIGDSLVRIAARSTNEDSHSFPAEKSALLSLRPFAALRNVVKDL
jgi:hypothetical protein